MIVLKSGDRFWFRNNRICDFVAQDAFFTFGREVDVSAFIGNPVISEQQAIERFRHDVEDLHEAVDRGWWGKDPEVIRPNTKRPVPRLHLQWRDQKGRIHLAPHPG